MINKIKIFLIKKTREVYLFFKRMGFKNKDVSIICNNCIGGAYYRCLRNKFNSPLINLNIRQEDFPYFVIHLNDYLKREIYEIKTNNSYPVGIFDIKGTDLKPIQIEFIHYKTFNEAKEKWNERRTRVNFSNIRVILDITSRPELENRIFEEFENISYKKIILTGGEALNSNYFKINFFDNKFSNGRLFQWYDKYKKFYDQFDYKKFLS